MTITLWTIFEILINFYQGGLETWFIYRFLTPRSHERAKIWAVIFAVCEGCLVTAFNYFTVFEGFGSALYWASLLVFAFCFFSDNAVKKFLSISLSKVAILLITSLELNAVSSFFKISLSLDPKRAKNIVYYLRRRLCRNTVLFALDQVKIFLTENILYNVVHKAVRLV